VGRAHAEFIYRPQIDTDYSIINIQQKIFNRKSPKPALNMPLALSSAEGEAEWIQSVKIAEKSTGPLYFTPTCRGEAESEDGKGSNKSSIVHRPSSFDN